MSDPISNPISNNNNVVSCQAVKKAKVRQLDIQLQQDNEREQLGTRVSPKIIEDIKQFVILNKGKLKGYYSNEVELRLILGGQVREQQTANYATSSPPTKGRRNVIEKFERIKKKFDSFRIADQIKIEEGITTGYGFPIFHLNAIEDQIKQVLTESGHVYPNCQRTHLTYRTEVIKYSKKIDAYKYDVTGFMEHNFLAISR